MKKLLDRQNPVITEAGYSHKTSLNEIESKEIVHSAGIDVIQARLARTQKEAVSIAKSIGFPVALKIVSPQIIHKSDCGGVKLGLTSATAVARGYREMMTAVHKTMPTAQIEGVSVQRMARPGIEVIMGMTKDPQFGPVLMFGLGGVFVEVLKDVSFRIVPIQRRDASEMIREIRGYPILKGYRGQEPANITALEDALMKLSGFIEQTPEIKELDLNPMFAYSDGVVAVDARVILESHNH